MDNEEKRQFLIYLENLTPAYRKRLLKRLQSNYKSNVRNKTKKYMTEHNINFDKCIMCEENSYIEIHHIDYSKPYIISPLCMKCHRNQHSKKPKEIKIINLEDMVMSNAE